MHRISWADDDSSKRKYLSLPMDWFLLYCLVTPFFCDPVNICQTKNSITPFFCDPANICQTTNLVMPFFCNPANVCQTTNSITPFFLQSCECLPDNEFGHAFFSSDPTNDCQTTNFPLPISKFCFYCRPLTNPFHWKLCFTSIFIHDWFDWMILTVRESDSLYIHIYTFM